jgi:hypothetical protein
MPKYSSYRNYSTSSSNISHNLPYIHENSNKNISSSSISNTPGFLQTVKDGYALGVGSSVGQLITYTVLGGPKVNVQHTHINENNILPCNNTKNCGEMLLEYEKCKGDYNCNFDKLNELKNNYEKCKSNFQN